jgi:hypothetical protein
MGMQARNHLQFGIVKPWARKDFIGTQARFKALQKDTIKLGSTYFPFNEPDSVEKKRQIVRNLAGMAIALEKLKRMTWFGDQAVKEGIKSWQETLPNAVDMMNYEFSKGTDMLKRLKQRLIRHGVKNKELIQPIDDAIMQERYALRMGSFGGITVL